MALPGMLGEVTQERVRTMLRNRRPAILDDIPDQIALFEKTVRSAAVEVVLLTGTDDPPAGPLRTLATEAIACEASSLIEYATYPNEQDRGLNGRGYHLHQRYLELLRKLQGETQRAALSPTGEFPPAEEYPDPAQMVWPGRC